MHGNRVGKNSRHPVPEGLDEVLHADPVHGQIAFRAEVLALFQPITFAVAFDGTLGAQQRVAFRTMPMRFSSRMPITIFFHALYIGKKSRNFRYCSRIWGHGLNLGI
jgi:hypothetical protein